MPTKNKHVSTKSNRKSLLVIFAVTASVLIAGQIYFNMVVWHVATHNKHDVFRSLVIDTIHKLNDRMYPIGQDGNIESARIHIPPSPNDTYDMQIMYDHDAGAEYNDFESIRITTKEILNNAVSLIPPGKDLDKMTEGISHAQACNNAFTLTFSALEDLGEAVKTVDLQDGRILHVQRNKDCEQALGGYPITEVMDKVESKLLQASSY